MGRAAGAAAELSRRGLEAPELESAKQNGVVRLGQKGDERSFEHYLRTHLLAVFPLVSRLLGDPQESLSVTRRSLRLGWELGLQTERKLRALAIRTALDRVRNLHRGGTLPLEELLPRFDAAGCHAVLPRAWSQEELRALSGPAIRALVFRLPEPYRAVLLLRDCARATPEEIALELSIDEKRVALLLHPARLALRSLIERTLAR